METSTEPLCGIAIIRRLVEVKEQAQREAVETYQNDPEVRAMCERLKQKNNHRRVKRG